MSNKWGFLILILALFLFIGCGSKESDLQNIVKDQDIFDLEELPLLTTEEMGQVIVDADMHQSEFLGYQQLAMSQADWHSLSDGQRNYWIFYEIYQHWRPGVWGNNCKEWARTVVKKASSNVVIIPPTITSGEWQHVAWQSHKYVVKLDIPINKAGTGHVVQMRLSSNHGPHTLIILGYLAKYKGTHAVIAHSNWSANYDEIVRWHLMPYAWFDKTAEKFSIYQIK